MNPSASPAGNGYKNLLVCECILKSVETGKTVKVPQ